MRGHRPGHSARTLLGTDTRVTQAQYDSLYAKLLKTADRYSWGRVVRSRVLPDGWTRFYMIGGRGGRMIDLPPVVAS